LASSNYSTQLATSSSLSLPWLYKENDQTTTLKADVSLLVFSLGNQWLHSVHNGGSDLCSSIPRELPKEVVGDAVAISSCNIPSSSGMRDNRNEHHNIFDWPLLQMGNTSKAEMLETPLVVDFSYLQSPADSFFIEDIWDGGKVNSKNVSKWLASKLKGFAARIWVAFSGYENEGINQDKMLSHPRQVYKEHHRQ